MYVVATAGHVDHGKSTLVRALTGIDPDRFADERRRGMTIDLGFASTVLPGGDVLAFVDVPGHARFIGNMLAGLGPVPAVLFVVAADEGWRPQSAEHLAAVDALGLRHGLLAVTRRDLHDPQPAMDEALQRLRRSTLGEVDAVAVSGTTGEGIRGLRTALQRLVDRLPAPDVDAPLRLWVDRAFTVRGTGTVVTGTLAAGTVQVGDELILRDRSVRVRALQVLGSPVERAEAVARIAVGLRGIDRADVQRGDVLLGPAACRATSTVDVRLRAPGDVGEHVLLHVGTASVPVRVRSLGADVARLVLSRPLPLRAGDRAVLRDPAGQVVTAGAVVLDADPPPLSRRGAARARAAQLAGASGEVDVVAEVSRRGAVRRADLAALGAHPGSVEGVREVGAWLVSEPTWQHWTAALRAAVEEHDARAPLDRGLPHEAARRAAGAPDIALVAALVADTGLVDEGGRVRAVLEPGLGPAEDGVRRLEERLAASPFSAPERPELDELGLGAREVAAAAAAGRLLRLRAADGSDVVLLPDAPARAMRVLAGLPQPFVVSVARQALGTTRRVAVPLLEHLDGRGWTRRVDAQRRQVAD